MVCPASLKINWRRELEKWLVHPCLPMLAGDWFPISADVVITNFERLKKHHRAIASRPWKTLIVDEAHFLKNDTTQRSQEVYAIKAERKLFLTGTPIPNRVREIYPLLAFLAPDTFSDRDKFMNRYGSADAYSALGKQALAEFNVLVRSTVMVRRLKEEVLTDLPPKQRQVIEFSGDGVDAVIEKEKNSARAFEEKMHSLRVAVELAKASDDPAVYAAAVKGLKEGVQAAFGEMSKLRHDTALVKVPYVTGHIRDVLAEGGPLVLFAHHHDVIEAYRLAFANDAVVLTGENTLLERDAAVRKFQAGEAKLFIGGIQAAGVGLTLTKASHVAFAEMDWTPGNMTQAEDRCHRIGQKDSVLVQHLVLEGSLDATMAKTLVAKQEVIEQALDSEKGELSGEPMVPAMSEPATTSATKAAIAKEALTLSPEDIAAIHAALKALTAENKVDAAIARSLAETRAITAKQAALGRRILAKYTKEGE